LAKGKKWFVLTKGGFKGLGNQVKRPGRKTSWLNRGAQDKNIAKNKCSKKKRAGVGASRPNWKEEHPGTLGPFACRAQKTKGVVRKQKKEKTYTCLGVEGGSTGPEWSNQ